MQSVRRSGSDQNCLTTVQTLIDLKANVNAKDFERTVLMHAAETIAPYQVVKALLLHPEFRF
jgi:hypothetical protein